MLHISRIAQKRLSIISNCKSALIMTSTCQPSGKSATLKELPGSAFKSPLLINELAKTGVSYKCCPLPAALTNTMETAT